MAAPLTASYVYAVVAGKRPSLRRAPSLPGAAKPRLLDAEGVRVLVADVPLELYDAGAIERGLQDLEWVSRCAIAHERAIECVSGADTVLPMKLFTIFHSEERALAHVARTRKKIDRLVKRLQGKVELGARVAVDPARAARPTGPPPASGASFLARKKEQRDATRDLARNGAQLADSFHERLARLADDATKRPPAGPRLVLDAAYLVLRSQQAAFKKAFAREARELEALGLDATLTGPWPPYHFAGLS